MNKFRRMQLVILGWVTFSGLQGLKPFFLGMVITEFLIAEVIWWMTSKRKVQLAH